MKCDMVVGWKVAADGESPGDEIECESEAVAVTNDEVNVCQKCADEVTAQQDPDIFVLAPSALRYVLTSGACSGEVLSRHKSEAAARSAQSRWDAEGHESALWWVPDGQTVPAVGTEDWTPPWDVPLPATTP